MLIAVIIIASCRKTKNEAVAPQLSVSSSEELFNADGGVSEVNVSSNTTWSVSNAASWFTATASTTTGNGKVSLTVQSNPLSTERSAVISVSAGSISKEIKIRQSAKVYGDSIPADATGMSSNAVQLAAKIKLGFNIGNTLEAIGGETNWGNPKITKAFVDFVKQSGFNAIRIPCSFDQYSNTSAQIKTEWLNRVKEVVQYCIDDSLYVILNIHWDGGWLENNAQQPNRMLLTQGKKRFGDKLPLTCVVLMNTYFLQAPMNQRIRRNANECAAFLSSNIY